MADDRVASVRDLRARAAALERRVADSAAALERERGLVDAVVAQLPAGLIVAEAPSGRIVRRNDEATRILRDPEYREWVGFHPDGRPYEADEWPLARALRKGESVAAERIEIRRGDGSRGVIRVSAAPIRDSDGVVAAAVTIFEDVTVRDRRERAERDFVTNAAHELQSPLAGILSAVDVLQSGAKETPDRDVFLGHIEREAKRLVRLARGLLALARVEIGYDAPRADVVALGSLLEEVARDLPQREGVETRVECDDAVVVATNADLLEQVVTNLARNAAKHTTRGRVTLAGRAVDGRVELSVIDTGPGIPPLERARVFDRFHRGGARSSDGFGLGLAIVRSAVDALGGELELDSTVGAGTIVRVSIPNPPATPTG